MKVVLLRCLLIFLPLIYSCSDENGDEIVEDPVVIAPPIDYTIYDDGFEASDNVVITHVKKTSKTYYLGNFLNYYTVLENDVINNRYLSGTQTDYQLNPPSSTVSAGVEYFYENDRLISVVSQEGTVDLHYDSVGRLSAAEYYGVYFRYSYPSEHIVICEDLSLPAGDSSTTVMQKFIMRFSTYGNIIEIGVDINNDDVPDGITRLTHRNGNIVSTGYDSNQNEYTYNSEIINTGNILNLNTYGKKNYTLLRCRNSAMYPELLSRNVVTQGLQQGSLPTYEINAQGYVTKSDHSWLASTTVYQVVHDYTID